MPDVETPHLNARALSWASLKVVGILSAIHGRLAKLRRDVEEERE